MFYKAWLNCIWLCSSCKTIEDINYAYNPWWRKRKRRNNACARLMLISARTAPKTAGVDDIFTAIVSEGEKEQLATEMEKIAEERRIVAFKRDGTNVKNSELVVLIGVRGTRKIGLDCGACGYANCEEFEKAEKKNGTRLRWSNMCIQVPRPRYSLGFSSKNR